MKAVKFTLGGVFMFLCLVFNVQAQENEPNNSSTEAQAYTGGIIQANLDEATDNEDWFLLQLTEAGDVTIDVSPDVALDVSFVVYASDGITEIISVDDGTLGYQEKTFAQGVAAGSYYLKVSTIYGSGAYSVDVMVDLPGGANSNFIVDDFEDGDLNNLMGMPWVKGNDFIDGGLSTIDMNIGSGANGSAYGIDVSYTLSAGSLTYNPYVNIATQLSDMPQDLSTTNGISITYKGDALDLLIQTNNIIDFDFYRVNLASTIDWTTVFFPWSSFNQAGFGAVMPLDLTQVNSVIIQTANVDGTTGTFSVDDIFIEQGPVGPDFYADFNATVVNGPSPLTVNFIDNSVGEIVSWEWDFENDGNVDSYDQSPTFTYTTDGVYDVRLVVTNANNEFREFVRPSFINVGNMPQPSMFYVDDFEDKDLVNLSGYSWTTMSDQGAGGMSSINLDFAAGADGSQNSLAINYSLTKDLLPFDPYVVVETNLTDAVLDYSNTNGIGISYIGEGLQLLVKTADITDFDYYGITLAPATQWAKEFFTWNELSQFGFGAAVPFNLGQVEGIQIKITQPNDITAGYAQIDNIFIEEQGPVGVIFPEFSVTNANGVAPFTTQFNNESSGNIIKYEWDFENDGIIDSYDQFPSFTYNTPGVYTVKLTVYDDANTPYVVIKDNLISVGQSISQITPDFTYSNGFGSAPLFVDFYDASTTLGGTITNWEWDFDGDGYWDYQGQSTSWMYETPGIYNVTLTVYDENNTPYSVTKNQIIEVQSAPQAEYCTTAQLVGLGDQYFNFGSGTQVNGYEKWYTYTFQNDAKLNIDLCNSNFTSNAEVQTVVRGCNWEYDNSKYTYCGNKMSRTVLGKAGDVIYFNIYVYENTNGETGLNFLLEEFPLVDGDICSMPLTAIEGINVADNTQGSQWFSYSTPGEGNLIISSVGHTTANTLLEVYSDCNGQQIAYNDDYSDLQSEVSFPVNGETVLINWNGDYNSEKFDWNIQFIPAGTLVADFNADYKNITAGGYVDFTDKSLSATSWNWDLDGDGIFDSQVQNPSFIYQNSGFYNVTLEVSNGTDTKSITKNNYVYVQKQSTGTICDAAVEVSMGTNTFDYLDGIYNWYKYTVVEDSQLSISLCNTDHIGYASLDLVYNGCIGDNELYGQTYYCGNNSSKVVPVQAGMEVFFRINSSAPQGGQTSFTFEVNEITPQPGDKCDMPLTITDGIHSIVNDGMGFHDKWYTYTAPYNGILELNTCINQDPGYLGFSLYSNCQNTNDSYVDYQWTECSSTTYAGIYKAELEAGQTILIQANGDVQDIAQFQIKYRDFAPGEKCTNPIEAVIGINTIPAGLNESNFIYTATEDGLVTLSNCAYAATNSQFPSSAMVTADCSVNASILTYGQGSCGNGTEVGFEAKAGVSYYITWYTDTPEFELLFNPGVGLPAGYTCENPFIIDAPQVLVPPTGNLAWLELTFPESGQVSISSDINTEADILILDACIPVSENMSSSVPNVFADKSVVFWPEAGVTYKMLIVFHETAPTTEYNIFYNFEAGKTIPQNITCDDALAITEGPVSTTTETSNYWYSYTSTDAAFVSLKYDKMDAEAKGIYFDVYDVCPSAFDNNNNDNYNNVCGQEDISNSKLVTAGQTIYIHVQSNDLSATLDWELLTNPSNDATLYSLDVPSAVEPVIIDETNKTISVVVSQSSSLNDLNLNYSIAPGAQLYDEYQNLICPSSSIYFNNSSTILTVKSADGTSKTDYTLNVTQATFLNTEAKVIGFSDMSYSSVTIDEVAKVIDVEVKWNQSECGNPYIQLSAGASFDVSFPLCLTEGTPITMKVTSEDGANISVWTINTTKQAAMPGDICDLPMAAVEGANQVVFDYSEDVQWLEYTVVNNGILEIEGCNSDIQPVVYSDCTTQLTSNMVSCGADFGSKTSLNVTSGQKVLIQALRRDNYYFSVGELFIKEIPAIISNFYVTPATQTVEIGTEFCLNVSVLPSQSLINNIDVTMSGAAVEQGTNEGCFIGNTPGVAQFTFTTNDGSNITKTVNVEIVEPPVFVAYIILPEALTIKTGEIKQITSAIAPTDADNKGLVWNTTNPYIVEVDQQGNIFAVGEGEAIITAKSLDGSDVISNECVVTVTGVQAESIIVNKTTIEIQEGEVFQGITATVLPTNASNKDLVWTSSDETIVKIFNYQPVGVTAGDATITIALASDNTISKVITVKVIGEIVDKSALTTLTEYVDSKLLTVVVGSNTGEYPQDALTAIEDQLFDAKVVIEDAAATQASVSSAIVALEDALSVFESTRIGAIEIAYLNIKKDAVTLMVGELRQAFAEILPANATHTDLVWSSANSTVATVNQTGGITAVAKGDTYIYARSKDGSNKVDSIKVTVKIPLAEIYIEKNVYLSVDETYSFAVIAYPTTAYKEGFVWSTDDESVIQIDEYGNVIAIAPGTATVYVYETSTGTATSSVVTVSSSTDVIAVTGIDIVRESITLKLGATDVIYPVVEPYNASNPKYTWSTESEAVFMSNNLVAAFDIGETYVYATTEDGAFVDSCLIIVVPSEAPFVAELPNVSLQAGTASVQIDIARYIYDDNTAVAELVINVLDSDNFTVVVDGTKLTITPNDPSVAIDELLEIEVVDVDNLLTLVTLPVTVSAIPNTAPKYTEEAVAYRIIDGGFFAPLNVKEFVTDDYTPVDLLQYKVTSQPQNLLVILSNGTLEVERIDPTWIGKDSVQITATDESTESATKYFVFEISQAPNQAPVVLQIPEQVINSATGTYESIDLRKFVKDDYTFRNDIQWSVIPAPKLDIAIYNGVAAIAPVDYNWVGSVLVQFIAEDEDGLTSKITVKFTQTVIENAPTTWYEAPKVSFDADAYLVGTGQSVSFTSSMSGADSWIWEFEGLDLSPQERIVTNPTISYPKGGTYNVKLSALNEYGETILEKQDFITVIGIERVDTISCVGTTTTLSATVASTDGYTFEWSNGANTQTIEVDPKSSTEYSLSVFKGFFEYADNISIFVPDTLKLQDDAPLCGGESINIEVSGFESYNWNNTTWEPTATSIEVTELGVTTLSVEDQYGCISTDEFEVTALYTKPTLDLGDDQSICDGTSASLDATITDGDSYVWSTNEETAVIDVTTAGEYIVTATDINACVVKDTINIEVLKPYKQELGVATFAKDGLGIVIAFERTEGQRTVSYEVFRETSVLDEYESIGTLQYDSPEQSFILDDDANALKQSYRYKLATTDECGNTVESDPHRTLHIVNSLNTSGYANLQWEHYEGIAFSTYEIYRGTNADNMDSVGAVTSLQTSWVDDEVYQSGWVYRVAMVLTDTVETRYPTALKEESGPYSLAMSNIAEAETAISELDSKVAIFPTVAETFVTVSLDASLEEAQVSLVSQQGAVVYSIVTIDGTVQIPVANIANGAYTVKVTVGNQTTSTSIVVK